MKLKKSVAVCAYLVALLLASETARPGHGSDDKQYSDQVRPFLARHCLECHGAEKPKGNLRLDQLLPNFDDRDSQEKWLGVRKRVRAGEMPPKAKPRPPEKEVLALSAWISGRAEAAVAARRAAQGRVVLRRLNRVEYENTVRDLLGVEVRLKDQLPQDGPADGFDNAGAALHTSSFLMERYLEAADAALNVAIANRPKPPTMKRRYSLAETHHVTTTTESVFRKRDDTVVCFSSSAWNAVGLTPFY